MDTTPTNTRPHHPAVLAQAAQRAADLQIRIADAITAFAGSMPFVYIHVVVFAVWMLFLESKPWPTLTLIVSLEAIFLSTFVMIGQNRQAAFQQAKADHDFNEQELELKTNTELTRADPLPHQGSAQTPRRGVSLLALTPAHRRLASGQSSPGDTRLRGFGVVGHWPGWRLRPYFALDGLVIQPIEEVFADEAARVELPDVQVGEFRAEFLAQVPLSVADHGAHLVQQPRRSTGELGQPIGAEGKHRDQAYHQQLGDPDVEHGQTSSALRALRLSLILAITSAAKNNRHIGIASRHIVNGSPDGVATAANTKITRMMYGRNLPSAVAGTTPTMFSSTTTSGIRNAIAEHQHRPDHEVQVLRQLDQVLDVQRGEPDQDLDALRQRPVRHRHTADEQRRRDRGEHVSPTCARCGADRAR